MAIFLSYRRADSQGAVDSIYRKLVSQFGEESVFTDTRTIAPGSDFQRQLEESLRDCDVFLAFIGDQWLDSRRADGTRQLDDPADNVRVEIEAALSRDIPVIPVLLGNASIPDPQDLPRSLRSLAERSANKVRLGSEFSTDLEHLIRGIKLTAQARR